VPVFVALLLLTVDQVAVSFQLRVPEVTARKKYSVALIEWNDIINENNRVIFKKLPEVYFVFIIFIFMKWLVWGYFLSFKYTKN
jgi:hypothetical protein